MEQSVNYGTLIGNDSAEHAKYAPIMHLRLLMG